MNRTLIEKLVQKHEGRRNVVYIDDRGNPTIGIGWNLDDEESADICEHFGLTLAKLLNATETLDETQIEQVFGYQLTEAISECATLFPTFRTMPDDVQAVVCDLMFNLGLPRFSAFHATIASLNAGDWKGAAANLKNSAWFHQVKSRGTENVAILEAV